MVEVENIKKERTSPENERVNSTEEDLAESPSDFNMESSSDEDDAEEVPTSSPSMAVHSSAKTGEANLVLLKKVFPHLDHQILIMILKACENDLVRAIESLVQDKAMKPFTPIPPMPHTSPAQRVSMLQHMPFGTAMARPAVLQSGGVPFAAVYPGYVHGIGSHGASSPGVHQWNRLQKTPYGFHGDKTPWCITLPNQTFCNKSAFSSRALASPELPSKTSEGKCEDCMKVLNVGDKFCSQCGKMTSN